MALFGIACKSLTLSKTIFMTDEQLIPTIKLLPEALKKEVLHYVEFITSRYSNLKNETPKKPYRTAGSAMGKYTLAADFDAPLEDFKDYM